MTDCPNGEIRDMLPDLVHARLNAAERDQVKAHVAECADCTAEVALLERIRASAGRGASVNVGRVVNALPRAGRVGSHWTRRVGLRIAAGLIVVLGVASWLQRSRGDEISGSGSQVAVVAPETASTREPTVLPASSESARAIRTRTPVVASRPVSLDADLAELSDSELQSLLRALDSFEAVTRVEPAAQDPILVSETR
jgi:hypothetical protein